MRLWRPLSHRNLRREGSCTRSEQPVMTQFPDRSRTRPWTDHPRTSNQLERLFLVAGRSTRQFVVRFQALLNMPQNPGNQCRLLDTGNHSQRAAAIGTGLDVNGEYPLQTLRPTHGRQRLVAIHPAPRLPRHDPGPVFEVRGEHPWNRVRLSLGRGMSAASLAMKSNGSSTTWVEPSLNG